MQNYKNHSRLNPAHHFVLTPLTITLFVWSIFNAFDKTESLKMKIVMVLISTTLVLLALIARSYGIKNQDRIIRLEMRQRYFEMTGTSFSSKEKQLKMSQIIALRFASDAELLTLMDRAIAEKLSSKEIKMTIKDWQGDYHRV